MFSPLQKTDVKGKYWRDFAIAYELTQIIGEPTRVPNTAWHQASILDLFITSWPDKWLSKILPPLGLSDHSLISIQINTKPKPSPDVQFHRIIFLLSEGWLGQLLILCNGSSRRKLLQACCLKNWCPCHWLDPFSNGEFYTPSKVPAKVQYIFGKSRSSSALTAFWTTRNSCKKF